MADQLGLDFTPKPPPAPKKTEVDEDAIGPTNGTVTSYVAAASTMKGSGQIRGRVLEYIVGRGRGGATREEIELALKLSGNTVRPRVAELLGAYGHERSCYEGRDTRLGRSGRKAAVVRSLAFRTPQEAEDEDT